MEILSYIVGLLALAALGYFIYKRMTAVDNGGSGTGAGKSGPRDPTDQA